MLNAKIASSHFRLSLEEEMFVSMKLCSNTNKETLRNSYKTILQTGKNLSSDWIDAINATVKEIDKDLTEIGN
jgi:hypothetical protein